jgi:hypothetical protein
MHEFCASCIFIIHLQYRMRVLCLVSSVPDVITGMYWFIRSEFTYNLGRKPTSFLRQEDSFCICVKERILTLHTFSVHLNFRYLFQGEEFLGHLYDYEFLKNGSAPCGHCVELVPQI